MTARTFVIPFDHDLIYRLGAEQGIVPVISDLKDVRRVVQTTRDAGSKLHCVKIDTGMPLAVLDLPEGLKGIPMALYVSGLGRFTEFAQKISRLREMDLCIFMPAAIKDNLTASRILSSLGFENGLILDGGSLDWEGLADLMIYALFARAPHAPIAPFNYMADHYDPVNLTDYSTVYFNDPKRFLHLDLEGRVALTSQDLEKGELIAGRVEELETIETEETYIEKLSCWRVHFLKPEGCAYCPGWRICIGKFSETQKTDPDCKTFFSEFLDALDQRREGLQEESKAWQF